MRPSSQYLIRVLTVGTLIASMVGAVSSAPAASAVQMASLGRATIAVDSEIRPAADLSQFRAGNIISDATFYDSSTMSAAQIQSFLQSKVPVCQAGYTCLKDWTDTSRTVGADAMCGAYAGVANERASQIIYKVAQACGINPRVLLVTLQKEQGLVTHTWPSDWRYTIAMGQGCPDTAACDTRYYGFFNQVFGAAWQMKRYSNPPGTSAYFTWYAPGKTWNVRFSPNSSCGSSPVYIENQATANLYYYTPYQPNAASLRAGYGEGDGCSTYGNRNFFNYFTDWFGSTQSAGVTLARTASNPSVFLLAGSNRWNVPDGEDYAELARAFGQAAVVTDSFLAAFAVRGSTGAVLHNASTGVMSLVQGGILHPIPTCEIAAMWGSSCGAPTTVSGSLLAKLAVGPDVGSYFRLRSATTWGRFDSSSSATPLFNEAAARAVGGDMRATPFAPYLPTSRYASLTKSGLVFAPGQLVRTASDPRVYMTADFDRLLTVNAWSEVAEYNRLPADLAVVPTTDLARYRTDGAIAPTLRCSSGTYFAAGGMIHRLDSPARAGLPAVDVAEITCAQFPVGTPVENVLALRTVDNSTVFAIEQSQRKRAVSWSHLVAANAGTAPIVLFVKPDTINSMSFGAPIADGALVKGAGPELAMVSGLKSHWVQSFAIAQELGVPTSYTAVTDAEMAALTEDAPLSLWVDCNGVSGFAAGGRVYPVDAAVAAEFTPITLSPATCARLSLDAAALSKVFVKAKSSPAVYIAEGGAYRQLSSWSELVSLSGGTPKILEISDAAMSSLTRESL